MFFAPLKPQVNPVVRLGETIYMKKPIDKHRMVSILLALALCLAPTLAFAQIDVTKAPYNLLPKSTKDQSLAIQAALDQAGKNGGGRVVLPAGTIYAKGLSLPSKVTLSGQGIAATVLKLPKNANTFLMASQTFVNDKPWANVYGGVRDLTFDGNKQENNIGSLLIVKTWRLLVRDCAFKNSPLHGVMWSDFSRNNVMNKNHFAEVRVINCSFDSNDGAGIYGKGPKIADGMIYENNFNNNGSKGFYQIDLERSAGFHVVGNQMYSGKFGDLRALGAGALLVRGNNFDGSSNTPVDGRVRQVVIKAGGWGSCVISANLFHNHTKEQRPWTMLDITTHAKDAISVSGNVFRSEQIEATPYTVIGKAKDSVVFHGNAIQKKDSKSNQ